MFFPVVVCGVYGVPINIIEGNSGGHTMAYVDTPTGRTQYYLGVKEEMEKARYNKWLDSLPPKKPKVQQVQHHAHGYSSWKVVK